MKTKNRKSLLLLPLCGALMMAFSGLVAAASGKVQFVSGDVRIKTQAGETLAATKGMEINEGDMIVSGLPGLAQLRMDDGGTIVVRPNTRFTIAAYRFNGTEDGSERATYKLDQGSVRAITGQIGKTNKQNYLIQTPTASIGVRGTDHEPAFIPKDAGAAFGAKPGTYDKVNTGETYIETKGGMVVVKPNSVGYAEDELSVPTILPAMPGFYNKSAKKSAPAGGGDSAMPLPIVFNPSTPVVDGLATYTVGVTQIEQVRNLQFDSSAATLAERSSNSELGVNWGRWSSGFIVDGKDTRGSLHFVNSTNLTSQTQLAAMLPITATYNSIGGTRPTDEIGRVGDLTSISATVNFATQQINDYRVIANNSGRAWDASGSGTFGQFLSSNEGLRLNGFCNGCRTDDFGQPISPTANGLAKGAFVGAEAQGLITTYGLQSNEASINGAAVLKRP